MGLVQAWSLRGTHIKLFVSDRPFYSFSVNCRTWLKYLFYTSRCGIKTFDWVWIFWDFCSSGLRFGCDFDDCNVDKQFRKSVLIYFPYFIDKSFSFCQTFIFKKRCASCRRFMSRTSPHLYGMPTTTGMSNTCPTAIRAGTQDQSLSWVSWVALQKSCELRLKLESTNGVAVLFGADRAFDDLV